MAHFVHAFYTSNLAHLQALAAAAQVPELQPAADETAADPTASTDATMSEPTAATTADEPQQPVDIVQEPVGGGEISHPAVVLFKK